jgi:hypothetical protein
MSYYQYEPPVAMFSMAEVDKYNNYQNGAGVAAFAKDPFGPGPGWRAKEAVKGVPRTVGRAAGKGMGVAGKGVQSAGNAAGTGARKLGILMRKNPTLAGAGILGAAAIGAGAGGVMFMRRRRSKTGKMIVEQVRR